MRTQQFLLGGGCLLLCVLHCLFAAAEGSPFDDWVNNVEKAYNQRHWERIVKRGASRERWSSQLDDDTSHIVNIQDYYRLVFAQSFGDDFERKEKRLHDLLRALTGVVQQDNAANIQDSAMEALELSVHIKPIKGRYFVMFQSSDADDYLLDRTMKILENAHRQSGGRVRATDMHPLRHVGKGFTATLNRKALELLAKHPQVAHIEEDKVLKRSAVIEHEQNDKLAANAKTFVPWNLDRIDQHSRVLDTSYNPFGDGQSVSIYIIDTGVRASHNEFEGRVHYAGFDAVDYLTGSSNHGDDLNGHGTHCAGIVAGKTYGVAKKAKIYNLRALNGQGVGSVSGIVIGIDEIIKRMKKDGENGEPIVISQSLGVSKSITLNGAIKKATEAGILCVGAAGNQRAYSCDFSPASAKVGIAVGATNIEDEVALFTNTGECTDMMAPGVKITSASNVCDTCTKVLSGTSMAAPHVSGYAAILLDKNPNQTPSDLKKKIVEAATKNTVKMTAISTDRAKKTANKLLYVQPYY